MKEWIVTEENNLKDFTDSHDPQASFFFDRLLKAREIKINGERVAAGGSRTLLKSGDRVCYYLTRAQEEMTAFDTVYEDENLLVTDKADGVNAEAVYETLARERGAQGVYFIHRLDRNTRGLMIFAKNAACAEELKRAFKERDVKKTYLAVMKNCFSADETRQTAYLAKDAARAEVRVSGKPSAGAEKIVTGFQPILKKGDIAVCEVFLHTGKTHQIRAHAAFLGHPVLGDTKYGDKALNKKYGKTRQCLIAKKITLRFSGDSPLAYADGRTFVSRYGFEEYGALPV